MSICTAVVDITPIGKKGNRFSRDLLSFLVIIPT